MTPPIGQQLKALRQQQGLSRKKVAKHMAVETEILRCWEAGEYRPTQKQLVTLAELLGTTTDLLYLRSGQLPQRFQTFMQDHPQDFLELLSKLPLPQEKASTEQTLPQAAFQTERGQLFQGDCIQVLKGFEDESVHCVFADPPFNLGKDYGKTINDELQEEEYLAWSRAWIDEAIRVLKPGGAFFLYNIPKWNIRLADYIDTYLHFKHWIAVDIKFSLPIPSRLYPSHFSLLYFTKGKKPLHFSPPRLPLQTCRHCGGEWKDYGGYKSKMNPKGVSLTDVWGDIPPVRHKKYKYRSANQLSLKLLDRILDIATKEGDLVLDPFGGSGTTYVACELKGRRWLGAELGTIEPILDRFEHIEDERELLEGYRQKTNTLFTQEALALRAKHGHDNSKYRIS